MKKTVVDNVDALLYASIEYAGQPELEIFRAADMSYEPSKKFKRWMNRFIRRAERDENDIVEASWITWAKRFAAAVLIVMSIGFTFAISIGAVREAIWSIITEWYDRSIAVMVVNESEESYPSTIIEYREPSFIPDGFERYDIGKNAGTYLIEYESADALISYDQSVIAETFHISNKDTELTAVNIAGHEGLCSKFETQGVEVIGLIWTDGEYKYSISGSGNIDIEQLIEIAESVGNIQQ